MTRVALEVPENEVPLEMPGPLEKLRAETVSLAQDLKFRASAFQAFLSLAKGFS